MLWLRSPLLPLHWLAGVLGANRWCSIIFSAAIGIVYRSYVERALRLVARVGTTVVNPSEHQHILRSVETTNSVMGNLFMYCVCVRVRVCTAHALVTTLGIAIAPDLYS